jgi:predicted dehydrogenase
LGGGAALTLSHDLDVALWITGSPLEEYKILKSNKNTLEIDVEGSADVLLKFEDSTIGQVHLNFVQRNPERRYSYRFDGATLNIDFFKNNMTVFKAGKEEVLSIPEFDRNDLFVAQTRAFMHAIKFPNQQWNSSQLKDSETILAICNEKSLIGK